MTIDERSRYAMYQRLEAVLGAEAASTLMEHLPPVGWADVATKRDLVALEANIDAKLEALEHRVMSALYREMNSQTRTLFLGMIGLVLTTASLTFTAAHLGSTM